MAQASVIKLTPGNLITGPFELIAQRGADNQQIDTEISQNIAIVSGREMFDKVSGNKILSSTGLMASISRAS